MKNVNSITSNILLNVDSYKTSHFKFLESNTANIFSYIEARKGGEYDYSVFFGLQYFLKKYMLEPITREMIEQAAEFLKLHGEPFNREGWEYILEKHNGYLPLKIKAVKEGSIIPEGNVLVTIENTDSKCAFLGSYFETAILRAVWYGTTVATRSYEFKKLINEYLEKTGTPSLLPFKLIDFGARGVSSKESAEISGAAFLLSFSGTDNIVGILATLQYYNAKTVLGLSLPASEHSVVVGYGKEREKEFIENAINQYGGKGKMISLVADSYDIDNFIKILGVDLKQTILDDGCTIIVRPDSGSPIEVVLSTVRQLEKYFGTTMNDKGYKVLHPSVRVIQGDGITLQETKRILYNLSVHGYSADNITFGCGGYLLQQLNRDTLRFAMKASSIVVDGESRNICKTPKTDLTKSSKAGRLILVNKNNVITTIIEEEKLDTDIELLQTVYENGKLLIDLNFEELRN